MILFLLGPLFVVFIALMMVIGFIRAAKHHRIILGKYEFACNYREKFMQMVTEYFYSEIPASDELNSEETNPEEMNKKTGFNQDVYDWLMKNVTKMQNDLGKYGLVKNKGDVQRFETRGFPIYTNIVPKLRNGDLTQEDVNSADDCMLKYLGHAEDRIRFFEDSFKNPIVWMRAGILIFLSIPLLILSCFDIVNRRWVNRILDSSIYKMLVGAFTLTGFIVGGTLMVIHKEKVNEFLNYTLNEIQKFIG